MPYGTIEEAFLNFIAGLELTEQSVAPAMAKSQQLIELAGRELKVNGSFFGGPYRRGTGVPSDTLRLHLVLGSKYYYSYRENSTKLLYFLKNRLSKFAGNALVGEDGMVIRVKSPGVDLDLVLSIKLKSFGYLTPNGLGGWFKSNPDKEEALFKAKDKASSGRFLQLVKVIKAWNLSAARPFDPYYLELLVYYRVNDFNKTYAELVHSLFASMRMFLPEFLNCPAADEVISCGAPDGVRKLVIEKAFDTTAKAINECDVDKSSILWRSLLGAEFGRSKNDSGYPAG
ncbi:hypothetical protein Psfp_02204 [Pelotomaculum sp. FP]|uniref:hypothetical protein n=1 Tax=Pelotomaculum sp. FP TaxID=261474 RepID=UPI001064A78D|nr:hypothetical protein [Pelotomaculum sp. FP]TEB15419.1 hypothetical protein Psfp_02204 [Pelotomaculum sp. FP]